MLYSNNETTCSPPPHRKHAPRSPTQRVPSERDGSYDKPEFVQPQEETLMSIVLN